MVVIGAGGAGKALAYGAKEKGAKVVIANRTYGKTHILHWLLSPLYILLMVMLGLDILFGCHVVFLKSEH